ncbi:hypothetical protein CPB85DRAFT_1341845 [Mucidula mucida]|nr:hypothetical protein CPB85DRAFT_1341845 [Mucidula mucida]
MAMSTLNRCATPSLLGMPNEILSDIIQLVPGLFALPVAKTLLRLCAVCRDLQTLVKEMPSLWSTIQIDARTPNYRIRLTDTNAELVFPTLNLALSLSRSKPLDVEFTSPPDEDQKTVNKFSIELCEGLMSLLLRHSHRIRSFRIKGTCWTHHLVVTKALADCRNLPNLRFWKQECVRSSALAREYSFLMAGYTYWNVKAPFLSASHEGPVYIPPRLEVVSITSSVYSWSRFSCTGVTEFRLSNIPGLDRPTTRNLLAILTGVKDTLKILELSYVLQIHRFEADPPLGEPLVLSSLTTFHLAYTTGKEVSTFLPYIAMPNLRSFSLKGHCDARIQDADAKEMLLTIMAVIPLDKVEYVTLERIPFRDFAPTPPLSLEQWEVGKCKIPEFDLPITLQSMRRLESLIHMHVSGASRALSNYVGYPGAIPPRKP